MTTLAIAAILPLAACAENPGSRAAPAPPASAAPVETIAISVGPCFGFCPIYEVSVSPDGAVGFNGLRHTAIVGTRQTHIDAAARRRFTAAFAPYRPASGSTARVDCVAAMSDTPIYTIAWTDSAGTRTTATHQSGCPSGPGHELDVVLRDMPATLGIADWMKQTTRPGESRG